MKMAVDPRLESLPEHQGPAFRTWQLIMQTTMGSVLAQPPSLGFQINESISPGEDYISLDQEKDNDDVKTKQKKKAINEATNETLIPWKSVDQYSSNALGLHEEILDFHKYMSPLPEEESMRQNVVDRISALIVHIWPHAKVEVFGSFRTKLYLPTSDIDLAVFGKWEKLPLFTLEKELINNKIAEPSSVKVLDKASVPIIKLTDKLSKIRVDISFNVETSIKSAEMIKSYIEEYKVLPALFLSLKHFLAQRDLNEVFTGGISSYCLMLLTISFLQRHPRVDVRKCKTINVGVLLMEFFELYGRNFNYQRTGVRLKGEGAYVSKEELAKDSGNILPLLCIEDPVTGSYDIGRSSYGILRVKEAFEYAFNVVEIAMRKKYYFKHFPNSTYMSRIVSVSKSFCDYRKWVQHSYKSKIFIPKPTKVSLPSLIYSSHDQQYGGGAGRPALLPTPPNAFSPRLPLSPFSPFNSPSPNSLHFNHVAFFNNENIRLVPTVMSDKDIASSQKPMDPFNPNRFVTPGAVPYLLNQDNSPVFSHPQPIVQTGPVKSLQGQNIVNSMFPGSTQRHPLNSVLTSLNQQRRNNAHSTIHCKPAPNNNNNNNNNNNSGNKHRNISNRSSHKTSPMLSPKFNNKFSLSRGENNKKSREKPNYYEQSAILSSQPSKPSQMDLTPTNPVDVVEPKIDEVTPVTKVVDDVIVISDSE